MNVFLIDEPRVSQRTELELFSLISIYLFPVMESSRITQLSFWG